VSTNTYQISQFDYYRRSETDAKIHLEELLKAYPNADAFEKRKLELKKCIAAALGIKEHAQRTALNPIFSKKIVMEWLYCRKYSFESIPDILLQETLYSR
jgi:hypothetical protein